MAQDPIIVEVPLKPLNSGHSGSPEEKSFLAHVFELPVVVEAVKGFGWYYSNFKERNSVTAMVCYAGESTLNMATSAMPLIKAASSKAMTIQQVDNAATTIDFVASETLAKVEEKLPIITKTSQEIKETVTTTATEYFEKVQNCAMAKMFVTQAENLVSLTELVTEMVLPTDGNCKEDMDELEAPENKKGFIERTKMVTYRLARRSKTKLVSYKSVQLNVNAAHNHVKDIPAVLFNMTLKATDPLANIKNKALAYVQIPKQAMVDYVLSSRPVRWIVPKIMAAEAEEIEIALNDIEIEDMVVESEDDECGDSGEETDDSL